MKTQSHGVLSVVPRQWHKLMAWVLAGRARRRHRKLREYVRHAAREITAWTQEIHFIDEQIEHHFALAGASPRALAPGTSPPHRKGTPP